MKKFAFSLAFAFMSFFAFASSPVALESNVAETEVITTVVDRDSDTVLSDVAEEVTDIIIIVTDDTIIIIVIN